MKRAFIFLNGELQGDIGFYKTLLSTGGDIYCADGGAYHLYSIGEVPLEILGDLDSVDHEVIEYYEKKGTVIKRFQRDKDFTDGELILEHVSSMDYEEIIVLAALGGRTDHMLTNLNLLFKFKNIKFITPSEEIAVVDKNLKFLNLRGKEVSFIPFSDEVEGVTLKGFKFPLKNYSLNRGDSICMSNVINSEEAEITFDRGKLICIVGTI